MQLVHRFESDSPLGRFFADHGPFRVDLFFVLSGIVMSVSMAHSHQGFVKFITARLLRIYPAYWFWLLITIAVGCVLPIYGASPIEARHLLSSILLVPCEHPGIAGGTFPLLPVGWTLYYEVAFYFLIGMLIPIKRKSVNLWIAASTLIIVFGRFFRWNCHISRHSLLNGKLASLLQEC